MSREMKDSGIAWIGEIPKGWEVRKMRTLGTFSASGIDKLVNPNESLVRIINYVDVYNNTKHELRKKDYMMVSASDEKITEHQVKIGDIILTPSSETVDDIGVSSVVMEELPNTAYSYHVLRFRSKDILNLSFKKYLTNNRFIAQYFSSRCNGTIRKTVSREIFKECPILLPPLPEQQKIAEFLDRKCGEIDELVALQEKMIEELKAYKQSVITEAVTKGLNPNAPMKDSGIEWIDYVPKHWQIRKMKSIIDLKSGSNLTAMEISEMDDGYLVYGGNGVRGTYGYYSHEGDYVLIGRQGALCGNINYASGKFWVTEHALVCYLKESCALKWLGELLRAMNLNQYSLSAAQPGLSAERIRNLYVIVPPLSEQQQIADYLDRKCAEIDELVAVKQQKIETLKEYKKSLIYEYVTGKKEVI